MNNPIFLTVAEVKLIHQRQIKRFGGMPGVRDEGLLESAVAMPQQSFEGVFLHKGLFEMASALAFHISQNHPLIDGNKRSGLAVALLFLRLNNIKIKWPIEDDALYQPMIELAEGKLSKIEFSEILKSLWDRQE